MNLRNVFAIIQTTGENDWRGGVNNEKTLFCLFPSTIKVCGLFLKPLNVARNDKHCCTRGERIGEQTVTQTVTTSKGLLKLVISPIHPGQLLSPWC